MQTSYGLYDKQVDCPVCKSAFTTKKVKTSAIRVSKRYPDYYCEYAGDNPVHYGAQVCPNCGYAALEGDFKDIEQKEIERVKHAVTQRWKRRSFGEERTMNMAIEAYKLSILAYTVRQGNAISLARASLRLSWLYRESGDIESENQYKRHAAELFQKAYSEDRLEIDEFEETTIMYTIGELLRQLGAFREAVSWFSKALHQPNIKKKRHLENRLRDQWQLATEQYRQKGGAAS